MARAYSEKTKQKVRSLRQRGWTLGEINGEIDIPKSTISGWIKGIKLTKGQQERIRNKIFASSAIGRSIAVRKLEDKTEQWKEEIRNKVKYISEGSLLDPEIAKMLCGLLYLCEGSKYPSSQAMIFGNSDSKIIAAFLNLLRKCFRIREDKLRCRIMPRWDQDIDKLQRFWSRITRIPLRYFYKTKAGGRTRGTKTKRKDYMGICALTYCDTALQFELQAIGERIIKIWSWRGSNPRPFACQANAHPS